MIYRNQRRKVLSFSGLLQMISLNISLKRLSTCDRFVYAYVFVDMSFLAYCGDYVISPKEEFS